MEYFNPEKLLTLQIICCQSVTPIKMGPKNLEHFFLFLYPVTIKYTIWDILKNKKKHRPAQNYSRDLGFFMTQDCTSIELWDSVEVEVWNLIFRNLSIKYTFPSILDELGLNASVRYRCLWKDFYIFRQLIFMSFISVFYLSWTLYSWKLISCKFLSILDSTKNKSGQ